MAAVRVGDNVTVPGDMHGTVKFVGNVAGKKGTFAGVQLAAEYSSRGKNSGDVDGKHYFRTSVPGSGIFLPIEKAVKRKPALGASARISPPNGGLGTPTRLTAFNQGGRTSAASAGKPNFSQSVGPSAMRAGAASPALKPPMRRESLPRPQSPLRKVNTPVGKQQLATPKTRPSLGFSKSTIGSGPGTYRTSPGKASKFSHSLRQPSVQPEMSPLGPEPAFDDLPEEEAESTPTPTPAVNRNTAADESKHQEEMQRMQKLVDEKEKALQDQAGSIAEMERSLTELQRLMPALSDNESQRTPSFQADEDDLPRDVVNLRVALREKNEKIKLLTAEFDSNRADFRSTIDTLEMASTETERVYEKRVDELLEEVRNLQDRSEDVESVAQQLKQLEELVQELEEGLEDARRGEAEARSEVEFLRGEVERSQSELRREKERLRTEEQLNGYNGPDGERIEELQSELDTKDDEIRGLKAIIHNLNSSADTAKPKTNGVRYPPRNESLPENDFQKQISDLENILQQKTAHEEELKSEVKTLRNSMHLGKFPMPGGQAFGLRSGINSHSRDNSQDEPNKHTSSGTMGSQRTVVLSPDHERKEWHTPPNEKSDSPLKHTFSHDAELYEEPSLDSKSDASASSAALWCEICEESGHDILTCVNMISTSKPQSPEKSHSRGDLSVSRPAPLISRKSTTSITSRNSNPGAPPDQAMPPPPIPVKSPDPVKTTFSNDIMTEYSEGEDEEKKELRAPIEGTGEQAGMWAGKSSGIIDPEKWCALCERDGHESVDCPIEDAF